MLIASGGGQGITSSETKTVGEGSNAVDIEMSVTTSKGSGFAFDIGVTIEAEAGAGGFTVGTSAGFHYGESYNITTSDSMVYGGSVSSIPEADWDPALQFDWGLFSYRGAVGSERFVVVQYFVESN
jgi:hypothetical protein